MDRDVHQTVSVLMRRVILTAVLALPPVLSHAQALQEPWPTRPVTMVVPYGAGGPVDTVGRIMAARLSEIFGQQVIVENSVGAGGMTGSSRVARAPPDGYTFLLGGLSVLAQNQTLYRKPMYDARTDFTPVSLFADSARILVTRKDLPVKTLPEFVAYAKANAPRMQFASAGAGSGMHICAVLLNAVMGVDILHVPYRTGASAMQDMMAGRIDFIAEQISTAYPAIVSGNVKGIATLATDRPTVLPDLPTAKEHGLLDVDCSTWSAFVLPKGAPDALVQRLLRATSEAVDTPAVRERFESVGVTVAPPERRSPEYLRKFIASELDKWAVPIRQGGVVVD
jgi:tripartite-type tricarboxylate transporter receptor subunit TctC